MTKRQLIEAMERLSVPDEAQMMITWEGQVYAIREDQLYVSADGVGIIDADGNVYRQALQEVGTQGTLYGRYRRDA